MNYLGSEPLMRGDGTAPADFPSYSAARADDGKPCVRCNYRGCGHVGTMPPTIMNCVASCTCECCRLLGGATVHGLTIGTRSRNFSGDKPQKGR